MPEIFDFLRLRYVALTPEEWVRQHFTHFLVDHKGYPKGLLANEVALRCGEKTLRCDSLVYSADMHPLMIVEYKAPDVPLSQRVFTQISAYNLLVMRSFFQSFPSEIEEAAEIDGCGKFRIFFQIVLPSSKAVIATVGLFYGVGAWNQYATPLMMIQDTALFPLQLKIHQLVNAASGDIAAAVKVSTANYTNDTLGAAAVIFSMVPVLLIYPFVQKYFAKGAMLGSVKG